MKSYGVLCAKCFDLGYFTLIIAIGDKILIDNKRTSK